MLDEMCRQRVLWSTVLNCRPFVDWTSGISCLFVVLCSVVRLSDGVRCSQGVSGLVI